MQKRLQLKYGKGQLAFRALHVNLNLYRRTVMMLPVAELGLGIRKYFNDNS